MCFVGLLVSLFIAFGLLLMLGLWVCWSGFRYVDLLMVCGDCRFRLRFFVFAVYVLLADFVL